LGLPDRQICLQSSISGIVWDLPSWASTSLNDLEQGYGKCGTKIVSRHHTELVCLNARSGSHRAFTLEEVQQGIKSSVLLPFL
ncbi:hypothetical protein TNCV_2640671, partial [Trichonephila clavipes]